jgi:hypothetical protein
VKQKVKIWVMCGFLVLLLIPLMSGCKKTVQDTEGFRIGVFNLEKAMRVHPRYSELQKIDQEIVKQKADAARGQLPQPDRSSPGTAVSGITAQEISGYQQAIGHQVEAKMIEKRKELEQTIDAQIATEKQVSSRQVEEYAKELDNEYQPSILSIQLKMQTVQLTPGERDTVKKQLSSLQEERAQKISVKQNALEQGIRQKLSQEQAVAEEKLRQYHANLINEANTQLAEKRKELESRTTTTATEGTSANLNITQNQADLGILQEQREKLVEIITKDLKDITAKVAAQRKLEAVLIQYQQNVQATDITDTVIAEIKK